MLGLAHSRLCRGRWPGSRVHKETPSHSPAHRGDVSFPLVLEGARKVEMLEINLLVFLKKVYKVFAALLLLWINISVQVVTW